MATGTVDVDRSVRIPEDTLFTGKVRYQRAQYALVLYRDRLAFFGADSKAGTSAESSAI